jgi:RNA polymerase sigma-70 factor (ECF subfamily)
MVCTKIDSVYRTESGRNLATLIRLLGDFDLAEDAVHDSFAAALERWPKDGVPANPRAGIGNFFVSSISQPPFEHIDKTTRR